MSTLVKYYNAIENSEDAQAALSYLFVAAGDSSFTAEKRVGECFFTRGRGRKMDPELFSPIQKSYEIEDEDTTDEVMIEQEVLTSLNSYLEVKIKHIESEVDKYKSITKHITSLIIDLKSVYAQILSKTNSVLDFKNYVSPDIAKEPWLSNWDSSNLKVDELLHFSSEPLYIPEEGETALFQKIRYKVAYDRYNILDNLVEYFKGVNRQDIVDYILVNEFKFISSSTSSIVEDHKLSDEDFSVVNSARVTFISKRKIDLNYALELLNLPSTTYKKRSGKIKMELLELGEDLGDGINNKMQDYLLN